MVDDFKLKVQSLLGGSNVDLASAKRSSGGKVKTCQNCSLHGKRQVVDPTNLKATVLIVGEAPGREEEEQGRHFVGRSGQLLRECLKEAGWSLDDVQFANVCRCRPTTEAGGSRAPTKQEGNLCKSLYLDETLKRFRNVIVLGKVPEETVLGKARAWVRGHTTILEDKFVGVTHHPAYILRRQSMRGDTTRDTFVGDLRFFKESLTSQYNIGYSFVNSDVLREKCLEDIKDTQLVTFDLETTGLAYGSSVTLVGVSGKKHIWVIPIVGKYVGNQDLVKQIFAFKTKTYVAHNAAFDYKWLRRSNLCIRELRLVDTMLMAYLLNPGIGRDKYKLKYVCGKYGIRWGRLLADPDQYVKLEDLADYNAEDVVNTLRLYKVLKPQMEAQGFSLVLDKVMSPAINVLGEMELVGTKIDLEAMAKTRVKLLKQKEILEAELLDRFGEYNFGSSVQIQEILQSLGAKALNVTATLRWATDAATLGLYIDTYSKKSGSKDIVFLCTNLLRLREVSKMLSTYIDGLSKKVDSDGRLRGGFFLCGTATGRLSSSGPNLQNIPRDSRIKSMFMASEGRMLVEGDLSQVELRIASSLAPEPVMIRAYNEAADLHSLTASLVLNKDITTITKYERQLAKAVNFGLIYGQSAHGFREYAKTKFGVTLTSDEAETFRSEFFYKYSGLANWHRRVTRDIRGGAVSVKTPLGRIRPLVDGSDNHRTRQALNTPVQSTASDCNLLLMRNIWDRIDPRVCTFLLTVHDQFLLDVEKDSVEEVLAIVAKALRVTEVYGFQLKVLQTPLVVDMKVGESWGQLKLVDK